MGSGVPHGDLQRTLLPRGWKGVMIKLAVVLRVLLVENLGGEGWGCREIQPREFITERRGVDRGCTGQKIRLLGKVT